MEVPDIRDAVQRLIGAIRPPQVVVRIGYGWPTSRSPRRTVADLLMDERSWSETGGPSTYSTRQP